MRRRLWLWRNARLPAAAREYGELFCGVALFVGGCGLVTMPRYPLIGFAYFVAPAVLIWLVASLCIRLSKR